MNMHPKPARIIIENLKDRGLEIEIEGPGCDPKKVVLPATNKNCIDLLTQEAESLLIGKTQNSSEERLRTIGQQLFEYLGGATLRECLNLSLSRLGAKEYLWLQFRVRSPELEDYPLELLYDPILIKKNSEAETPPFLALSPQVLSTRYREQNEEIPQAEKLNNLRVLLVVSNPKGKEIQNLEDKLNCFRLPGPATFELEILENATPFKLLQLLKETNEPFHIIHFLGHGYANKNAASTGLFLEKENGEPDPIPSEILAELLKKGSKKGKADGVYPKLVVLNACHSADSILSVASELVNQGVPAVIGMRSEVSLVFASFFNECFYSLLRDKVPVERAMTESRIELYKWKMVPDWCAPVLYLRTEDGRLFDFETESNESKIWSEQLRKLHELADENTEQAKQALEDLLKLGASTIALSVAAILACPLVPARAGAAKLLAKTLEQERERAKGDDTYRQRGRLQPNTNEFDNVLSRLVGSALVHEPEFNVRREMTDILVQLNTRIGFQYLADFANELQAKIPQVTTQFNELAIRFRKHADRLDQLGVFIRQNMNPTKTQRLYTERLSIAVDTTRKLREYLDKIRGKIMTPEQIQYYEDPVISSLVKSAKEAIEACNNAFRSSDASLVISLDTSLVTLKDALESEMEQIRHLEDELKRIDNTIIADPSWQANIRIEVDD